jgi:hypothetical protein
VIDIRDALTETNGCAVPAGQVMTLPDFNESRGATREAVLATLATLREKAAADDFLFVWFSGHGVKHDEDLYLCTEDSIIPDLKRTALGGRELSAALANLRCRRLLMVLDCCQSAGFAERAPEFFRLQEGAEFRILLCASRADEPSWEIPDGKGTLFHRHFAAVLRGIEHPSNIPGTVYFTDLLRHLNDRLEEDLARLYPEAPKQQPVFAGTFGRDPLLFLHRGLSLARLQVSTSRYSPAVLRKILWRSAIGIAAAVLLAVATTWALLDRSQYAAIGSDDRVAIFQGIPGWQIFGYPRLLWTFDLGPQHFKQDSPMNRRHLLGVFPGEEVWPAVRRNLTDLGEAHVLHWEGRRTESATKLRAVLARKTLAETERTDAVKLLSKVADKEDLPLLLDVLRYPQFDARVAALVALVEIGDAEGFKAILDVHGASSSNLTPKAIDLLQPPCTDAVRDFLWSAGVRMLTLRHSEYIDAQARTGCGDIAFYAFHLVTVEDAQALAWFGEQFVGDQFQERLKKLFDAEWLIKQPRRPPPPPGTAIQSQAREAQAYAALHVAGYLRKGWCPGHVGALLARLPYTTYSLAQLIAKNCDGSRLRIESSGEPDDLGYETRIHLADGSHHLVDKIPGRLVRDGGAHGLISVARYVDREQAVRILRHVLSTSAEEMDLLRALAEIQGLGSAPGPGEWERLLSFPVETVRYEAWHLYCRTNATEAKSRLLDHLADPHFERLVPLFSLLTLTHQEVALLRSTLTQESVAGAQIATALALAGDTETLRILVTHPSHAIRASAVRFAAAHPEFDKLIDNLQIHRRFPDSLHQVLLAQAARKHRIAQELAALPEWGHTEFVRMRELTLGARALDTDGVRLWLRKQAPQAVRLSRGLRS